MTNDALIFVLLLGNVAQFFFWSYQNQKLVNKLMSRSFYEYEQAKNPPPPRGFEVKIPTDEELSIPDQTRIMDELTQRMI